ncbi:Motile sperm domain-containing protein 2 [Dissophora globulifera]|uniref:Motile sperm domain-containing protein 2 n=1 Tax=Dissophora globulifera TaxID=979702 RepID=A0A9P6UVI0_9FUNG|nr:Motile sperm domain-containing protein 2 [Dissophora globulifera]
MAASRVSSGLVSKLKIKNLLQTPVGYKFKTNAPLRYSVKPVLGVLQPGQSIEVFVRCESWVNPQDRFLLQSVSLGEDESKQIDAVTWKDIDRRRFVENFIQCSSSSTLSMRDPQDDGGSVSSSSSNASSTRSSNVSSTLSDRARLQQQQQQHLQQQKLAQLQSRARPAVAHVHAAGRKLSTSSATSSTTSSPGNFPTLFSSKSGESQAARSSSLSKESLKNTNNNGNHPAGLMAAPIGYLANKLSDTKQTIKTVSRFLAIRQYTKMQVFTVSVVCLLLGLLLPLEKIFMLGSRSAAATYAGDSNSQFRSGVIGHTAAEAVPILVTAAGGDAKVVGLDVESSKMDDLIVEQRTPDETRQDAPAIEVEGAL